MGCADLQRAQRQRRWPVRLAGGCQRRRAAQQLLLLRAALHAVVQVPHLVAGLHLRPTGRLVTMCCGSGHEKWAADALNACAQVTRVW